MNVNRFLAALLLAALMTSAAFVMIPNLGNSGRKIEAYRIQGEKYFEENLCKKAVESYQAYLSEKESLEVRKMMIEAYKAGLKNGEYKSSIRYKNFLLETAEEWREEISAYECVLQELMALEDYEDAATVLKQADSYRISSDKIDELRMILGGQYYLGQTRYSEVRKMPAGYYLGIGSSYMLLKSGFEPAINVLYDYASPFAEGYMLVKSGEYVSLVSGDGTREKYFDPEIDASTGLGEGLIACRKNGSYAYYDKDGTQLFGDYEFAGRFANGVAAVYSDEIWYLIYSDGEKVTKDSFEDIKLNPSCACSDCGVIMAKQNGVYSLYDLTGKRICDRTFEDSDFIVSKNALCAVKTGGKWGYIDTEGNLIFEPRFDQAKSFCNGFAGVFMDGAWCFIDTSGEIRISGDFEDVDYFTGEGNCFVKQRDSWIKLSRYY